MLTFSKKYNAVDVLRGSEALLCAMHEIRKTGKLFSEEDNLFEKSEYAKKEGWDKKRPQVLGFNNYVNFFVGGEYNLEKLLNEQNDYSYLNLEKDCPYKMGLQVMIK